jgi:hypothetical protein
MTIKIKRDKRQVFTGDSFVMTSTVLIKVEDNRLTYVKPITSKSQTFLTKAIADFFCSLRYFFLFW